MSTTNNFPYDIVINTNVNIYIQLLQNVTSKFDTSKCVDPSIFKSGYVNCVGSGNDIPIKANQPFDMQQNTKINPIGCWQTPSSSGSFVQHMAVLVDKVGYVVINNDGTFLVCGSSKKITASLSGSTLNIQVIGTPLMEKLLIVGGISVAAIALIVIIMMMMKKSRSYRRSSKRSKRRSSR